MGSFSSNNLSIFCESRPQSSSPIPPGLSIYIRRYQLPPSLTNSTSTSSKPDSCTQGVIISSTCSTIFVLAIIVPPKTNRQFYPCILPVCVHDKTKEWAQPTPYRGKSILPKTISSISQKNIVDKCKYS